MSTEIALFDDPVEERKYRQCGVFILDASGSMDDPVESAANVTKSVMTGIATRDSLIRFEASSKRSAFDFGYVSFHDSVSHTEPIRPLGDIDTGASFDPTQYGKGGTFIGAGIEEGARMAREYLAQPDAERLPSSAVLLVLSDGECLRADRTREIASAVKADPNIVIACCFLATKGVSPSPEGTGLLQEICSHPDHYYRLAYDAETIRGFFEDSMTKATRGLEEKAAQW